MFVRAFVSKVNEKKLGMEFVPAYGHRAVMPT